MTPRGPACLTASITTSGFSARTTWATVGAVRAQPFSGVRCVDSTPAKGSEAARPRLHDVALAVPGKERLRGQLLRFVLVGGFCALLDYGSYQLLRAIGMDGPGWVDLARAISFVIGTTTAYVLNKRFTFNATGGLRQVSSFILLYGTTFFIAVGVNRLMLLVLPEAAWQSTLAWVISQGAATTINFVMLKLVVFREKHEEPARSAE